MMDERRWNMEYESVNKILLILNVSFKKSLNRIKTLSARILMKSI
jgi:hypothetical protein